MGFKGSEESYCAMDSARDIKANIAPTDADLVKLVKGGDKSAYRILVERYQAKVFSLAYRIVRNREDAEDVAQEALVKAFFSISKFKNQSSFYTWLYRITFNMAIDFKRKMARRGKGEMPLAAENVHLEKEIADEASVDSPDMALERTETKREIDRAIMELSDEHRVIITLREIEGMSYEEIAQTVGISKGTVMSRLHYARKKLQKVLLERGLGELVEKMEKQENNN